ncbi:MAG: hypothetical protein COT74_04145 [Bdellovibrionales bacterium CG10_big_fil_rev_8_21_14_0_10_45_34]|nr:MAG: hypothetical protein COT74_04145 [Bdellovibrionales bacterium CG10_big_fil_rev_8_21_14_0_10_45_34]
MSILKTLGIDSTLWIQLASFLVGFLSLYYLIFKPYMKALLSWESQTVGGEDTANSVEAKAVEVELAFAQTSLKVRQKINEIFEEKRKEGLVKQTEILTKARAEANAKAELFKTDLTVSVQKVQKELDQAIPQLTEQICNHLMNSRGH